MENREVRELGLAGFPERSGGDPATAGKSVAPGAHEGPPSVGSGNPETRGDPDGDQSQELLAGGVGAGGQTPPATRLAVSLLSSGAFANSQLAPSLAGHPGYPRIDLHMNKRTHRIPMLRTE